MFDHNNISGYHNKMNRQAKIIQTNKRLVHKREKGSQMIREIVSKTQVVLKKSHIADISIHLLN